MRTDARDLEAIGGSWPAHVEPPVVLPHPHGSPTLCLQASATSRAQRLPDSLPAVGNREQGEESSYDDAEAASRRGMPPEAYDQVIAAVAESQTGADGFVAHYGVVDGDGITVIEIWDSQAQHDKWFDANVRSLLPPGTPEPEFWEIRASRTK
jgi:hypothetical protein